MKYKVGIIGCGRISSKHIEAIINNRERMELVSVCDIFEDRALEKSLEYKKNVKSSNVNIYSDYKTMFDNEKLDIVTIASESGYHSEIAIRALENKINVIVEKPMALSVLDAQNMVETARRNNKKLAVCFQNRFNPPVKMAYDALRQNRFGKILHAAIQIRWNRNNSYYEQARWRGSWALDGGTLMNQCTHGIDLLQWFMGGKVKKVYGVLRKFLRPIEAEDFGSGIVEFENGSVGIIEGSADIYPKNLNETLSIFGENASVVIGGVAVNKIETWRFKDAAIIGDEEDKILSLNMKEPENVYGYGHTALFLDFIEALDKNIEPFINGEEGMKALSLILALYKSMKEGRPVDIPTNFASHMMGDVKL